MGNCEDRRCKICFFKKDYKRSFNFFGIIFILLNMNGTISADENIISSWVFVNYGFGSNFLPNQNLELSAGLFNFFFDDYKTKIGFKLSPFNIRANIEAKETNLITEVNFINFCIYWNCLDTTYMILGPFSSIQYINLRDWQTFDYRDITINTGIKYIYKTEGIEKIDGNSFIMETELGYRYNYYDKHKFYFNISVDLISTLAMIGEIMSGLSRWTHNK